MTHIRRHALALAASATILLQTKTNAVTYTWTSTSSGNWSNAAQWKSSLVPTPADDALILFTGGSGTSYTATNDIASPFTLSQMGIYGYGAAGYTINGGPLNFVPFPGSVAAIVRYPQSFVTTSTTVANALNIDSGTLQFDSSDNGTFSITGPITGAGQVLTGNNGGTISFTAHSTFTGGARINGDPVLVSTPSAMLGTGPITVGPDNPYWEHGAFLTYNSAANVAYDHSVTLRPGAFLKFNTLDAAALNRLSSDSAGVLAISSSTSISPSLDLTGLPNLRIGTRESDVAASVTLSASITPAANTYRFGGQVGSGILVDNADSLYVASLLTDAPDATPRSVNIGASRVGAGGYVRLTNASNSYSGGTVIERSRDANDFTALAIDFTPAPGQTPLGTGPVTVYGSLVFDGYYAGSLGSLANQINFMPGSQLYFNNAYFTPPSSHSSTTVDRWPDSKPIALNGTEIIERSYNYVEVVGPISFDNGSVITIDTTYASPGIPVGLQAPSLTRNNHGTLNIRTTSSSPISTTYVARITGAAALKDPTTGMIPPYVIASNSSTADFVTANASGYLLPVSYSTSFNSASNSEIVSLSSTTTISSDETAYALKKSSSALTISAGKTLTLRSGGLIGTGTISGGTLSFADAGTPVEAFIFPAGGTTLTISSSITAAAGLTKFGAQTLLLTGSNNISGPVNVNSGTLTIGSAASLNTASVPIFVDYNATLSFQNFNPTLSQLTGTGTVAAGISGATQTITLDTASDSTFAGMLTGWYSAILALNKTGPGALTLSGFSHYNGLTTVSQGTLTLSGTNDIPHNNAIDFTVVYGKYATVAGAQLDFLVPYHIAELTGTGSTTVGPSASLISSRIQQSSLSLAGPVSLVANASPTPSSLGTLTITGAGSLDLANNNLTISSTAPSVIRQYLYSGQLFSSSSDSTHPLAYSLQADGTTILVTLAINGDANLDGRINADDYALLDRAFAQSLPNPLWSDGDFNYDGQITSADYLLLDTAFCQAQGFSPGFLAMRESQFGATYVSQLLTSIPEPSLLAASGLALLPLTRRRHRT